MPTTEEMGHVPAIMAWEEIWHKIVLVWEKKHDSEDKKYSHRILVMELL